MSRIAVVLFNLGGPDGPKAVRPFLRNLFADPAIIGAPAPLRYGLAELISRTREKSAIANYAMMGGASPLNAGTEAQRQALETVLAQALQGDGVRVFMAMRYWHPLSEQTALDVAAFAPDDVVLLPLYPHFSTTTTGSSLSAWKTHYRGPGRVHTVCCYFDETALIDSHATLIRATWEQAGEPKGMRLLFSAHGLPERISASGDPYRSQIERTCAAVAEALGPSWDWSVCYQSRVGPMKWIGPSTIEAIEQAGRDGVGVIVDPIAFVSEHIETLVELDHDYAKVAANAGVSPYLRVPALGVHPRFIEGLAELVRQALPTPGLSPGASRCDPAQSRCPLRTQAA